RKSHQVLDADSLPEGEGKEIRPPTISWRTGNLFHDCQDNLASVNYVGPRRKRMKVGDVIGWERTFTEADIRLFNLVSGDEGTHHVKADERGRLMVHGLLTATVPTKIG